MTGCATDRVRVEEVQVYVRQSVPKELTDPVTVRWPDGSCWIDTRRVLCNGELDYMARIAYPRALDTCNARLEAIRGAQ